VHGLIPKAAPGGGVVPGIRSGHKVGVVTDGAVARITLISKPGCHLCGPVREVIERVAEDLGVQWVECSILDDTALSAAYGDLIPVTLVDGVELDHWRLSEFRLRRALGSTPALDHPEPSSGV
jgi:Glutaredoxin-like domain (DUF836)